MVYYKQHWSWKKMIANRHRTHDHSDIFFILEQHKGLLTQSTHVQFEHSSCIHGENRLW